MAAPSPPKPLPMTMTSNSIGISGCEGWRRAVSDNMCFQDTVDNKACQHGPVTADAVPAKRKFRGVAPEDRKAERHLRLLEAGIEAYGTRGFHAVGVRDVCGLAKLTERYFYESFENREALFLAVYRT